MRSISSVALKLTSTSCVVKEFPVEGSKAKGSKAILFGWAGGSLQLVEKYVPLWNSAVSSVIVVATPLSVVKMLPENEVEAIVKRDILPLVADVDVFVHIFSNGGLLFGSRALVLLGDQVKKAVFDSSPCLEESAAIPALAVREAVPGPFWFKQFLYLMIFSVFTVWIALGRATGRSFSPRVYFGVPLILKSNAQKLFLFSSTDPFTDSKLLKEFIAKVGGYSFDFGDSKHVQHYRTYPELYRQEMQKFLKV